MHSMDDILYALGRIQYDEGDIEGAIVSFSDAAKLKPGDPKLYFYKALVKFETGGYAGAIEDLDKAISLDPMMSPAYVNRALARLQIWGQREDPWEDPIDALKTITKITHDFLGAARASPGNFFAHYNLGVLMYLIGQYESADNALTNSIELQPFDEIAFCMRGEVRCCMKMYAEGIRDFEAALLLDPDYEVARNNLACARDAKESA